MITPAGTRLLLSCAACLVASAPAAVDAGRSADGDLGASAWQHVRVLADDRMEGRRAGTVGHRRAAEYVAAAFERTGLEPGAGSGFFESVALLERTIDERASSLALVRGDTITSLTLGEDAYFSLQGDSADALEAPLVFAGYGLQIPEFGIDELQDLDLAGKVVVAFMGGPSTIPGAALAHYGSAAERWRRYQAAGAIGTILVRNPVGADLPWERLSQLRLEPYLKLADPALDEFRGEQLHVIVNPANAGKLFAGAPFAYEELLARVQRGEALPRGSLPVRVLARIQTRQTRRTSENVIGLLPGSNPELRPETVVLSAHLDHLGVGSSDAPDRIFNGAMDNASGVGALIEVAHRLRSGGSAPSRTIAFVAVTAEESGELGSRYYVTRALQRRVHIVADVNSDMVLPLFALERLIVFGLEESDLADDVRAVAAPLSILVQGDPEPQRNRFIRSDQYSFIRRGIPSIALKFGFEPDSPQAAVEREWFATRYHAPADDPSQPVDLAAFGRYVRLLEQLARRIAERPEPPAWIPSSIFAAPPDGA
jgi:Zn-dependent M28 family amino/carboxypeptidase